MKMTANNKSYALSLSYGKDSLACLGAVEKLGWPLDRIIHAEIWATDTIPADLPPMVEFKEKADEIIKKRWGITVEHICAIQKDGTKQTYERLFYHIPKRKPGGKFKEMSFAGFPYQKGAWCNDRLKTNPLDIISHIPIFKVERIRGFPMRKGQWCTSDLKRTAIQKAQREPSGTGTVKNPAVQYVGIAADETERLKRLDGTTKISPLAAVGWTEAVCRKWCEQNDLLSPIYKDSTRGGCWFCHNQSVGQLRLLRKNYPEYWALLLKWDTDSPVSFKPDGHTVHDYDQRFQLEDERLIYPYDKDFRWDMLEEELNLRWF